MNEKQILYALDQVDERYIVEIAPKKYIADYSSPTRKWPPHSNRKNKKTAPEGGR